MRELPGETVLAVGAPMAAPHWALLERQLLDAQASACAEYFARYFDDRGYLLCVPRWSGDANFITVLGGTKTLPQLLSDTRTLLAEAWG